MQSRVLKKVFQNGFWLSLLLHILLILAILIFMTNPSRKKQQPLPNQYVPAYTYQGSIKPAAPKYQTAKAQKQESNKNPSKKSPEEKIETVENEENIQSVEHTQSRMEVPKILKKMPVKKMKNFPQQKSLLASSFNMLKDEQLQEISEKQEAEPIYMIGDDSQPADPLIKLLGRSLSAHFGYPRMAGQLGIRGRAVIGLTLHPEGYYSHVQLLQSSNNPDLDAAALYAVNSAPHIPGAARFIDRPKHFVIGFIFN